MLHKGSRLPCGNRARSPAAPWPSTRAANGLQHVSKLLAPSPVDGTSLRNAAKVKAIAADRRPGAQQLQEGEEEVTVTVVGGASPRALSSLRLSAEAEAEAAVAMLNCRFLVPHFVTQIGQQLFLTGSSPELGEWDPAAAVPLDWHPGHQHAAVVRLPAGRNVQVKLLLMEHGRPVASEEGAPRDIMLLSVNPPQQTADNNNNTSFSDGEQQPHPDLEVDAAPEGAVGARGGPAGPPPLDYQILCHFGNTEAAQILRLPVVLPAKNPADRGVLCKFVVMLDGLKLEPRQYPVVVGSVAELGDWRVEAGVKLIRQVGGYWLRRVELPLHSGEDIQAKVVICNPDGSAAQWEPGTSNRVLTPARDVLTSAGPSSTPGPISGPPTSPGAPPGAMHIFLCRWSQPGHTPVVGVPVEYEDAAKEYVKLLDAAQKEVGLMRRAVTAKSRQVQSLESELSASRRAERTLREEVSGLRGDVAYLAQDLELAQRSELAARQEVAELGEELRQLTEGYENQISFLETKLDEMNGEIAALQERLRAAQAAAAANASNNNHSRNGYSNGRTAHEHEERVITRSNWR